MATTIETPRRSYEQRMRALEKGNRHRSYRKVLKAEVKRGERSVLDVLAGPPPEVATMKVFELLLAVPKWGRVKVNKTLSRAQVSPSKTVGGLSERQRHELVGLMRRRG